MKKMGIVVVALGVVLALGGCKKQPPQPTPEQIIKYITTRKVVDLSHEVTDSMPVWPGFKPPIRRNLYTVEKDGFFMNVWDSVGEHVGTHIGAPAHFGGKRQLQDIPVKELVAPLVVIDCTDSVNANPDYEMTVDDIKKWEEKNGQIPEGAVVLMRTGWHKKWYNPKEFVAGTEEGNMHFPGLGLEAAKWLVENRKIVGFAHETLGTDHGISTNFEVEYYLLGDANRYQVEVVDNTDPLPEKGALFVVLPPKFHDASGFPARAFAILPDPREGVDDTEFKGWNLWDIYENYLKNWEWVDCTHLVTDSMPVWPGFTPPERVNLFTVEKDGFFMNVWNNVGEHIGTHVGAPAHFGGKYQLADIPMEKFVVPFVVIDCTDSVKANPDYEMTVADIQAWEKKYGEIPKGALVIMRSGWGKKWYDKEAFIAGTEEGNMHFPGLGLEAAKWLVENRDIVGFGHETLGTDHGISTTFEVEYYLLGDANRYQVEVMANVDKLPEKGGIIFIGAPKFSQASGFPARVVAVFPPATQK